MISKTVSNDDYTPTLELSNSAILCKSLDISGINLNVHDVSKGNLSAIAIQETLTIQEGIHNFYNNTCVDLSGGGAIYAGSSISFIDTCMSFSNNHSNNDGGAIKSDRDISFIDSSAVSYTHLTLPTTPYV